MPNYDREKHIAQIQTEISRVIRLARRDLPASVHSENPSTPVGLETELLRTYVCLAAQPETQIPTAPTSKGSHSIIYQLQSNYCSL